MVGLFVEIEIVENTIEVGTGSTVEFRARRGTAQLTLDSAENALLRTMTALVNFSTEIERVVIVAVTVYVVGIKLFSAFFVFNFKETATS